MLERIERVVKVGLFEDYSHSAGCDFGEVTLIFGENGVGKSTIAALLDSLRERNAGEVIRRRSLPGSTAPHVAISVGGKTYKFDGHDWDDQLPYDTLEVFHPGFVSRNIHAATAVETDHRRNLCELILGRKAVQHVSRLAEVDNDARKALAERKAVEKDLELLIEEPDTLEIFLGLSKDEQIDKHIEDVRTELKLARNKDAIFRRATPTTIALPAVDHAAVNTIVMSSAEGIGASVTVAVREHVKDCLDKEGETWLEYGIRHTGSDNRCPFCAQDLTESTLIAAIRSYFSAEYRNYLVQLSNDIKALRDQLGTGVISTLRTAFAAQVAVAAQWSDEVLLDQTAINARLGEAESFWKTAAGKLGAVLAAKQANPLERCEPGPTHEALVEYDRAISVLAGVNEILGVISQKVEENKAALSKADTAEIERRLRRLENTKVRFEPKAQELLKQRNSIIERRAKLDAEKAQLKKDIDSHATTVVGKYQDGINYYLKHFGCDLQIESVEPKFPSGKASVHYTLKARGHEIELGLSEGEPCFATVLSDGDKYALALSFFFARLKHFTSLTGRIVVLDDPVNSFGSARRTLIGWVLHDLRRRGAQVIVLTHDERLAAMMWKEAKTIVTLQVERTDRGSKLVPWDVERATRTEYTEHYLTLIDFLENGGDHKASARCIRPYVEQRLRHLYPGPPFATRDSLGQLIAKIRGSKPGTRLDPLRIKLPDLECINDASLPSHHATDDVPNMAPLTPNEVRLFAQKALDVLG